MRYKSLFIDLDDTVWDTKKNNKECLQEVYLDYHFDRFYPTFESFFDIYMPNNLDLWAKYRRGEVNKQELVVGRFWKVLEPMGLANEDYILRLNDDFLERTSRKSGVVPGAFELLKYLRPSYKMFILSNGFREVQQRKLESAGLHPYFGKMILSEDAKAQKPSKQIFDYALVNTNSRREESLMIGDCLEADIAGAINANIDSIWFNPSGESSPEGCKPTYTVSSLLDIMNIL